VIIKSISVQLRHGELCNGRKNITRGTAAFQMKNEIIRYFRQTTLRSVPVWLNIKDGKCESRFECKFCSMPSVHPSAVDTRDRIIENSAQTYFSKISSLVNCSPSRLSNVSKGTIIAPNSQQISISELRNMHFPFALELIKRIFIQFEKHLGPLLWVSGIR